jgi:ribosome assembly protein 4
MEHVNPES